MPTPKPLSANLVAEEPEAPAYSRDDWIAYLNTAEGWNSYEAGETVPPDALREVLTLVPEKRKARTSDQKETASRTENEVWKTLLPSKAIRSSLS